MAHRYWHLRCRKYLGSDSSTRLAPSLAIHGNCHSHSRPAIMMRVPDFAHLKEIVLSRCEFRLFLYHQYSEYSSSKVSSPELCPRYSDPAQQKWVHKTVMPLPASILESPKHRSGPGGLVFVDDCDRRELLNLHR